MMKNLGSNESQLPVLRWLLSEVLSLIMFHVVTRLVNEPMADFDNNMLHTKVNVKFIASYLLFISTIVFVFYLQNIDV